MFLQSQILYPNPHFSSCAQICLGSVQLAGRDLLAFSHGCFPFEGASVWYSETRSGGEQ